MRHVTPKAARRRVDSFLTRKHGKPSRGYVSTLAPERMINFVARMKNKSPNIRILTVRDQKVVLDTDLAAVYGVTTKRLNEQLRRNHKRFPEILQFNLPRKRTMPCDHNL